MAIQVVRGVGLKKMVGGGKHESRLRDQKKAANRKENRIAEVESTTTLGKKNARGAKGPEVQKVQDPLAGGITPKRFTGAPAQG